MRYRIASLIGMVVMVLMAVTGPSGVHSQSALSPDAAKGREVFNQFCYHCHGTDAVQGERARDLRRLVKRYGDDRHDVFIKTVNEGRLDKGMPSWKGAIDDETFKKIWAYLETVQSE